MTAFLDELQGWTDFDGAAVTLGRSLGLFPPDASVGDVRGVLWTNNAVGNTLYGMLERLARLGVLECDQDARRYRAAGQKLHPLDGHTDVPSLARGPRDDVHIELSVDPQRGFRLQADRAGFRHLARVFDEIADSGLESGWQFRRDGAFTDGGGEPDFTFALIDPTEELTGGGAST